MKTRFIITEIIRKDDREIFSINDNGTYSLERSKKEFPNHLHHEYSMLRLLEEPEYFEINKIERIALE